MIGDLDRALREIVREEFRGAIRDDLLPALTERRLHTNTEERLHTLAEAQERLAAGWDTVDRLLRDGELEAVQVRGHRKVTAASLAAYIDRNRISPASNVRAVS